MKQLENKYILLDTNVIIYSIKYLNEFKGFFEELEKYNISPGIDWSVKLEFLRTSNTYEKLESKQRFLNLLLGDKKNRMELHISNETFEDARNISILYNFLNIKKKNNISLIDCLIAAQLKKYKNNLFLATTNNSDFPLKIFNRVKLYNVEVQDDIFNIGIYQFSEPKYNKEFSRFIKI